MDNILWSFSTRNYEIILRAVPEDLDPRDSFEFEDDIEHAFSGDPAAWFCAIAEVRKNGKSIGSDVLGGCSYHSFEDFISGHRDVLPNHRNTLANKSRNRVICHYFPDMVRQAIADARVTMKS